MGIPEIARGMCIVMERILKNITFITVHTIDLKKNPGMDGVLAHGPEGEIARLREKTRR